MQIATSIRVEEYLGQLLGRSAGALDTDAIKRTINLVRWDAADRRDDDEQSSTGHRGEDFCRGT